MFSSATFIVLDLPSQVASIVYEWRKQFDQAAARLPICITLAGSSGVGALEEDQDNIGVYSILKGVASKFLPVTCRFSAVSRFPDTDIFYLALENPQTVVRIHNVIASSGLRFRPSQFAYCPHCTISSATPVQKDDELELISLRPPSESFQLTRLTVYELTDSSECKFLFCTVSP